MTHRTSIYLYGPAVEWLEAVPNGLRRTYLERLILTSEVDNSAPLCKDPPKRVFSLDVSPECKAKLAGAANQSWAVQGIIERRIRAVEDALRLYGAAGEKVAEKMERFRVIGEEEAFSRALVRGGRA